MAYERGTEETLARHDSSIGRGRVPMLCSMQESVLHLCRGHTSDTCKDSDKSDMIDRLDGFERSERPGGWKIPKQRIIPGVSDHIDYHRL